MNKKQTILTQQVIFRKYDNGIVIALFPEKKGNNFTRPILSYSAGKYELTDYSRVIKKTLPAKVTEYNDMQKELMTMGYNLKVQTKRQVR